MPSSAAQGRHTRRILAVALYRRVNLAARHIRPAMDQREISLLDLAIRKKLSKLAMSHIILRYNDESARVLIETMNDSRSQPAAYFAQFVESEEQGINQRPSV